MSGTVRQADYSTPDAPPDGAIGNKRVNI